MAQARGGKVSNALLKDETKLSASAVAMALGNLELMGCIARRHAGSGVGPGTRRIAGADCPRLCPIRSGRG